MDANNNAIGHLFDFLNDTPNKKDISQVKVFENPNIETFVQNLIKSLDSISNLFRISAYHLSYITNADRENEIEDIKIKSNKKTKNEKEVQMLSFNIDDTVYHKLSMCITIDEKRLIADSEVESTQIRRANNKFVSNLISNDPNWVLNEEIGEFSYMENYQHSSQIIHIRIPDIQHNFVEIKNKVYYLTYNRFKKISQYGNKIQVNRFACKIDKTRAKIIRPYYFLSLIDDIIHVEFDGKKYNLFKILSHFNIQNSLVEDYPNDWYIQNTYATFIEDIEYKKISKQEFDKDLIIQGVLTLLKYIPISDFKYYRYGSIIDAISVEIVHNILTSLPRATGKAGATYYHADTEKIQKSLESISKSFKPNLFMSVLAEAGHESLKSTYNENSVCYPLKVSKDPAQIETVFKEEDLDIIDVYGTSQTKENVLKTISIPPFIDEKYLG